MKRWMKKSAALALALVLLLALLPGGALAASLTVSSLNANKTTAVTGDSVTWTASATGGSGTIRYCFYVFKNGKIEERGSYGTAKTYTYTPTAAGTYTVRVYVQDAAGTVATKEGAAVAVSSGALTILSITADKSSVTAGEAVTWTAVGSGGSGTLRYCFYVFKDGKIEERGSYKTAKTYTYTPSDGGVYTVRVYVKDGTGTVKTMTGGTVKVTVPITITSLKVKSNWGTVGEYTTWTAEATGGVGPLQYCFYIFRSGKFWEKSDWQASTTFSSMASLPGTYTCRVYVKDRMGTKVQLDSDPSDFYGYEDVVEAYTAPLEFVSLTAQKNWAVSGESMTWTAEVTGGVGALQYCFYLFKNGKIVERGQYGSSNTHEFSNLQAGTYTVRIYVKDQDDTVVQWQGAEVVVYAVNSGSGLTITGITPFATPTNGQWNVTTSGGTGTLEYSYTIFDYDTGAFVENSGWVSLYFYDVVYWEPRHSYVARVYVRDESGALVYADCTDPITISGA